MSALATWVLTACDSRVETQEVTCSGILVGARHGSCIPQMAAQRFVLSHENGRNFVNDEFVDQPQRDATWLAVVEDVDPCITYCEGVADPMLLRRCQWRALRPWNMTQGQLARCPEAARFGQEKVAHWPPGGVRRGADPGRVPPALSPPGR